MRSVHYRRLISKLAEEYKLSYAETDRIVRSQFLFIHEGIKADPFGSFHLEGVLSFHAPPSRIKKMKEDGRQKGRMVIPEDLCASRQISDKDSEAESTQEDSVY